MLRMNGDACSMRDALSSNGRLFVNVSKRPPQGVTIAEMWMIPACAAASR
jgi:hypothetical protein